MGTPIMVLGQMIITIKDGILSRRLGCILKENSRMDYQKVEEYIIIIMGKNLLVILKMM